jgi:hypothetical protein
MERTMEESMEEVIALEVQYFRKPVSPPALFHCSPDPKCQNTLDLINQWTKIVIFRFSQIHLSYILSGFVCTSDIGIAGTFRAVTLGGILRCLTPKADTLP